MLSAHTGSERTSPEPRFILDVHLGKLAYHLRMLGFDTLYENDFRDSELLMTSTSEGRILLSKDRALLNDPALALGYCVQQTDPRLQLIEVMRAFDLYSAILPFTRCLLCNAQLIPVKKEVVLHRLPERVRELFSEFQFCSTCDRVYWKGSHYARMMEFIRSVVEARK